MMSLFHTCYRQMSNRIEIEWPSFKLIMKLHFFFCILCLWNKVVITTFIILWICLSRYKRSFSSIGWWLKANGGSLKFECRKCEQKAADAHQDEPLNIWHRSCSCMFSSNKTTSKLWFPNITAWYVPVLLSGLCHCKHLTQFKQIKTLC